MIQPSMPTTPPTPIQMMLLMADLIFILVNAPYLSTLTEDPNTDGYADKIITKLEKEQDYPNTLNTKIRSPFHFYDRYNQQRKYLWNFFQWSFSAFYDLETNPKPSKDSF